MPAMERFTRDLWDKQDQHEGDRWRMFRAVGEEVPAATVLYPGSYVDIAPSFVFPSVTYLDSDKRAARFFADTDGVEEIISSHAGSPPHPEFRFIHGDYTDPLDLAEESFDLLVSLYAGFISAHCTPLLRVGGVLLVNSSHGDAAMASIDPRYRLRGVVTARSGAYRVLHRQSRLVSHTQVPGGDHSRFPVSSGAREWPTRSRRSAYLFERVC